MRRAIHKLIVITSLLVLLFGCSKSSPEQALSKIIGNMQTALEQGVRRDFSKYVSADFRDNHGNDKAALINIVRGYMLSHNKPKILVKILKIEQLSNNIYQVKLSAASAATGRQQGFNADLQIIEAQFFAADNDNDFKLINAKWRY